MIFKNNKCTVNSTVEFIANMAISKIVKKKSIYTLIDVPYIYARSTSEAACVLHTHIYNSFVIQDFMSCLL